MRFHIKNTRTLNQDLNYGKPKITKSISKLEPGAEIGPVCWLLLMPTLTLGVRSDLCPNSYHHQTPAKITQGSFLLCPWNVSLLFSRFPFHEVLKFSEDSSSMEAKDLFLAYD